MARATVKTLARDRDEELSLMHGRFWLEYVARVLIVLTFMEDAIRCLITFSVQQECVKCPIFLACIT